AAGTRFFHPASDVEEDRAAIARRRGRRVVADFQQPLVSGISQPHALALEPRRYVLGVHAHVLIVVREARIIDPGIPRPNLKVGPGGALRRTASVAVQRSKLEDPR